MKLYVILLLLLLLFCTIITGCSENSDEGCNDDDSGICLVESIDSPGNSDDFLESYNNNSIN